LEICDRIEPRVRARLDRVGLAIYGGASATYLTASEVFPLETVACTPSATGGRRSRPLSE
jgi:hypothetical protein